MHKTDSVHCTVRETFLAKDVDIIPKITLYPITTQQHQFHHFFSGGSSLCKTQKKEFISNFV